MVADVSEWEVGRHGCGSDESMRSRCALWIGAALLVRRIAAPIGSMARASLELFIARSEGPKQPTLELMAKRFSIEGFIEQLAQD